jgi:hypothetical protein
LTISTEEMEFYKSFIPHRREFFHFVQDLSSLKEWPNSNRFQLKKRAASLLIVSELDALASFIYGHNSNKKAFIDMLCEWTENEVFSAVWPKKLIDYFENETGHAAREVWNLAAVKVNFENLEKKKFQSREEYNNEKRNVIEKVRDAGLDNNQCNVLEDILWRISDEDGVNLQELEKFQEDLKKKAGKIQYYEYAKSFLNALGDSEFLKREVVKQKLDDFLQNQRYYQKTLNKTKNLVIDNLHHGSYAAHVYEFRCECVHKFDGINKKFSDVTYAGIPIENIDFDLLKKSYDKILTKLETTSIEEVKKMHQKHARSQNDIMSGVMPFFASNIFEALRNYN